MLSKQAHNRLLLWCGAIALLSACSKPTSFYDPTAQYTNDTTAIRSYIIQNNISATKLPSGVWFIIDSASKGKRATFNDSITVDYSTNLLPSNKVADQSATPITFVLSTLLPGIQYAMPQFQQGSKGRIFMPSYLAYQTSTKNGIPANSNLIFQFKLRDVKDYQLKLDTAAINAYLMSKSIQAISDPSGLHYSIDSAGTGAKPRLTDYVTVKYTVTLMSNGQLVDQSSSSKFLLSTLVLGWQVGLVNVKEGSKCTLYVPSSLGYGASPTNSIPINSNLVFTIQLLKVSTI